MNRITGRLLFLGPALLAAACSGSKSTTNTGSPTLTASATPTSIPNDGTKTNLIISASDASGNPGTGNLQIAVGHGQLAGAGTTANPKIGTDGTLQVTYSCDVSADPACTAGPETINVTWGVQATTSVRINVTSPNGSSSGSTSGSSGSTGGSSGSSGSSGTTAGGDCSDAANTLTIFSLNPAAITIAATANGGSGTTGSTTTATPSSTLAVLAQFSDGTSAVACPISFVEATGEHLVSLSANSVPVDATGVASVTITAGRNVGSANIIASFGAGLPADGGQTGFDVQIPISGTGVTQTVGVAAIIELASESPNPLLLGLQGSGVSESGSMKFIVTDAVGTPVPGVTVNFSQAQPNLVQFALLTGETTPSAITDATGSVGISFSSLSQRGVSSISATVSPVSAGDPTPVISAAVAVRGAKPSASHFYFQCDQKELPVLDVDNHFSETTCTVRLSDRFGARVGISTPVYFATESGSITASVNTAPFNASTPDTEGTATVTFTTDYGPGGEPVDVAPLAANPAQLPFGLDAEPSKPAIQGFSNKELNPRDQLVTIIAMTQGEEAFTPSGYPDAGQNQEYVLGDPFVDEGSPYIDANDDNVYDQVRDDGTFEQFFCAILDQGVCNGYQPPNGTWDSNTTIWTETFAVFVGAATPFLDPATSWQNGVLTNPSTGFTKCAGGVGLLPGQSESAEVYAYDEFLNPIAPNSNLSPNLVTNSLPVGATETGVLGGGTIEDRLGSMSPLFYGPVAASDGGACSVANGAACVNAVLFGAWGTGALGAVTIANTATPLVCTGGTTISDNCNDFDFVVTANNSLVSEAPNGGISVSTNGFAGGATVQTCQ